MSSYAKSGFTLVELLVAIALSLAIIGTATAAITMVAKVIGKSEQLSRHNQTVREIYFACTDDADFWWSIDDPFNAANQPYRTTNGGTGEGNNGHPFVPIELPPDYWNLRAHDPAYWQRIGSYRRPSNPNGVPRDFALISHLGDASDTEPWRATPHVVIDRTFNQLGIYGMADYLPPSWSWWYALAPGGANSFGDVMTFHWATGVPAKFINAMHTNTDYRLYNGSMELSFHDRFASPIARSGWALAHNPLRPNDAARRGIETTPGIAPEFYALPPHLRSRPPGWPAVRGGLVRSDNGAGRSSVIDAILVDPLTGERTTYHFMLIASSLRGARQQRDWPHWAPSGPPPPRIDQ